MKDEFEIDTPERDGDRRSSPRPRRPLHFGMASVSEPSLQRPTADGRKRISRAPAATDGPQTPLQRCLALLDEGGESITAKYSLWRLQSMLQPIYSFAHRRTVGHEALIRARDEAGNWMPPADLFASVTDEDDLSFLDRLCRTVHVANFAGLHSIDWLFLNVNPRVAAIGNRQAPFFQDLMRLFGIPEQQVVVEILETAIASEPRLEETVAYYRELGCLVAVDDFGAGHSNFERIWRLKPNIVKLDRRLTSEAAHRQLIRRSLPQLVSLLHEAGCIVLAEGIETEDEAMLAMDSNVDLAQGYFFARPSPIAQLMPVDRARCAALYQRFRGKLRADIALCRRPIDAASQALTRVAGEIESGTDPATAGALLTDMDGALRFFVVDSDGNQRHCSSAAGRDRRGGLNLTPLVNGEGATWFHRPYFRRAIRSPGVVQVTGPYLSLPDAVMCITLSVSVSCRGETVVLCFDILEPSDETLASALLDTHHGPMAARRERGG